jgi:uncharacterized Fe-S radical SAM superfamily protein PflX
MADEKLYSGHTAEEVIELMGMLAASFDVHSHDEWMRIVRKGYALLKEQTSKLNQAAVERDLARKERDSVSHRLDAALKKMSECEHCAPRCEATKEGGWYCTKEAGHEPYENGEPGHFWVRIPVVERQSLNCSSCGKPLDLEHTWCHDCASSAYQSE